MSQVPTVTLDQVNRAVGDDNTNASAKKVLEGILNDYVALLHGIETPYTTGKQVLPTEVTAADLTNAIADSKTDKDFKPVFEKILEVSNSGSLEPLPYPEVNWDPKLKPVLVVVRGK